MEGQPSVSAPEVHGGDVPAATRREVEDEEESKKEEEEAVLMEKAQKLMDKITSSPENPKAEVLHALACLLEKEESLYMKQNGDSSVVGSRGSHNIGRLGNLVRDNDEFFELISSKFLSETGYSTSVQASAARVLTSCSLTWIHPHIFEENVMENLKRWVIDGTSRFPGEDRNNKDKSVRKASDCEMRKTYSAGLLAVCLAGGGQVVDDVLKSGLAGKLMRFLRIRVLGESISTQKEAGCIVEGTNVSLSTSANVEEGRGRVRQIVEPTHLENHNSIDEISVDDQSVERDQNVLPTFEDGYWVDGEKAADFLADSIDIDADAEGIDQWQGRGLHDGKTKQGDLDESGKDDLSRCRGSRGFVRPKARVRNNEAEAETELAMISPGSGSRSGHGWSGRERTLTRSLDSRKERDARKSIENIYSDSLALERDDNDICYQECQIGAKNILDLVKTAVKAAEAEARAANAPIDAIKAAGDSAAEVVKSAALEEYKSSNDEEAAVVAASRAASTVIDAANAVEVCRSLSVENDLVKDAGMEVEVHVETEEYSIPDVESLAKLMEKFCIQCLVILGEYREALKPIQDEKGVDVCLGLLHRSCNKHKEAQKEVALLPDVMKLICALAAHRKLAALFVDRDHCGMQKLLAIPRNEQTFFGLSSCLFTIGSLQGIMERVCALPLDVVRRIVELAIQLLECHQEQAMKNAALFFGVAFIFRAVLDNFDALDGLQKLLGVLNDAASVRSGVNSAFRNDRSPPEVLTPSAKQMAYHTCVALRQYFRAHLLLLMESIRPGKSSRNVTRSVPSVRAAYKPLDISNEAIDAVFLQLQKDRKLGSAFARNRFPAVDKFLALNGHIILLELCQAPPVDRYLHDLLQYALGVLHIVTLVNESRKMVVSAILSNNRAGIAVILDAASIMSNYVDPEIIQAALNVLINLVCPPPSISNKPHSLVQGQQSISVQSSTTHGTEPRDMNLQRGALDRVVQVDLREQNGEPSADRGSRSLASSTQLSIPCTSSGLVGDRRIILGTKPGYAGLAAQMELGYRQAREAVRANNGIKVLLHLLQPRIYSTAASLDCIRALACRVLLGLARDDTIASILTKLQVGKKLSDLIRDPGSHTPGNEQDRWQTELAQLAFELIGIVTNSGRASTLAATDAATPTLRRIERAAIAAATPITYHSKELLLLIHEHLLASGLSGTAAFMLKEAQLTPFPSLAPASSLQHQISTQDASCTQMQWPSSRLAGGFFSQKLEASACNEDFAPNYESARKKPLAFSPHFSAQAKNLLHCQDSSNLTSKKAFSGSKKSNPAVNTLQEHPDVLIRSQTETDFLCKTPVLPMKRKLSELKDVGLTSSGKRLNTGDLGLRSPLCLTPGIVRKNNALGDAGGFSTPSSNIKDVNRTPQCNLVDRTDDKISNPSQSGFFSDFQSCNSDRLTLDSIVIQHLKHQHRQCPAPITTLPPLSLLHPHVCPEPKRSLDAPSNVTARLGTREFRSRYGGFHGNRKDRQFVFSRFRPWRTCRDDTSALLTCLTFIENSCHIAVGSHAGELKIFDSNSNSILESFLSHQSPVNIVQSYSHGQETQLVLSSSSHDVRLWDVDSISGGPLHSLDGCKAARFSNDGTVFAALSTDVTRRDILLYDVQTGQVKSTLSDTASSSAGRGHLYSLIHFSPLDTMLHWNGILWDRRQSAPVHRFENLSDYGGGGFHPAGNEVIMNSEVWDLRRFSLVRSVPSLDQTSMQFNSRGDVIYAVLRRNLDDVMSAVHTRRVKHPLFAAFRTLDAVNYSEIATVPVDRCVLDFATESTDSSVGLITMDDQDDMFSSARVYEIGRRRPTDDDSDPDDADSEDEDDDEDDDENDTDMEAILGHDLDEDSDSDADDLGNDDEDSVSDFDEDDDLDYIMDDADFDGGHGIMEIVTDGDEDDDDSQALESLSSEDEGELY